MGILQLQRNLTADTVEANYPEEELIRALEQASACAVIATTFAAGVAGNKELADKLVERALKMTTRLRLRNPKMRLGWRTPQRSRSVEEGVRGNSAKPPLLRV